MRVGRNLVIEADLTARAHFARHAQTSHPHTDTIHHLRQPKSALPDLQRSPGQRVPLRPDRKDLGVCRKQNSPFQAAGQDGREHALRIVD